ncbi:uncharacterized protein LOC105356624 [Oryzias latipes]
MAVLSSHEEPRDVSSSDGTHWFLPNQRSDLWSRLQRRLCLRTNFAGPNNKRHFPEEKPLDIDPEGFDPMAPKKAALKPGLAVKVIAENYGSIPDAPPLEEWPCSTHLLPASAIRYCHHSTTFQYLRIRLRCETSAGSPSAAAHNPKIRKFES